MKIHTPSPLSPGRARGAGKSAGKSARSSRSGEDDGFAHYLEAPHETGEAAALRPAVSISPLLGVQEEESRATPQDSGTRQARHRAEALLDELRGLQQQLLLGGLDRAALERLARLSASRRAEVADPALSFLLDQIDLRVAVELAKYGSRP